MFESKKDLEKKLYNTDLIQSLFDTINMLESRIEKLEGLKQ